MSASNEWTEWHLTSGGWVQGSDKMDFGGITEVEIPTDRVLTRRYHEHMSSSFSGVDYYYRMEWSVDDEAEVTRLTQKHGEHPSESHKRYRRG